MKIYGHPLLGGEKFIFVSDLAQLQTCQQIPCFNRTSKHWMEMAKYCCDHELEFALFAHEDIDIAYAMSFGANYLIVSENYIKLGMQGGMRHFIDLQEIQKWQTILQDYVSDVKLLFVVYDEQGIENALRQRFDAVVLANAICS